MTTPAASGVTILTPTIWTGTDNVALPLRGLAMGEDWPAGWKKFQNVADNITIDFQNPQIPIRTKDNGVIAYMPSGEDEISLSAVTHAPEWEHLLWTTGMQSSVAAASAQVTTLTITGTATAGGTMLVNPGGITPVPIALINTDTASAAATKVAAGTYPGYTPVANAGVVTFTATAAGVKGTPSVSGTPTGLTAVFATTTSGANEVTAGILNKDYRTYFRVGVEGFAAEGGLFDEDHFVRFFGMKVTPAEAGGGRGGGGGGGGRRGGGGGGGGGGRGGGGVNADPGRIVAGWAGEGGNVQVALNIEFLSDPNAATAFSTAGYPVAVHDPAGRAAWFNHSLAA